MGAIWEPAIVPDLDLSRFLRLPLLRVKMSNVRPSNRCSTKTSDSLFPEESFPERSKTLPDLPPKSQQMLNKNIRFPLPRRIISRKEQNAPRFTTKKPTDAQQKHPIPSSPKNHFPKGAKRAPIYHQKAN